METPSLYKQPLYALILCGGESSRMMTDKSLLEYHNMPQWLYLYNTLMPLVDKILISCREDQRALFENYDLIFDGDEGKGPAAGLLAANKTFPDVAWLLIACDLPLLTNRSLKSLVAHRNHEKIATTFIGPENHLPEPVITIWETAGIELLRKRVAQGFNSLQHVLEDNDIELLQNEFPNEQINANTPEEREKIQEMIKKF
ncbi:NTP transferase domain-containing protein [Chitinophagaceae bacterium 26-R-25]|nr:NTP transferase domain-containing protein [Chitinophagaceae bacterium 26-R-25]